MHFSPAKGRIGAACPSPAAPRHSEHSFGTPRTKGGAGPESHQRSKVPACSATKRCRPVLPGKTSSQLIPAADSQYPRHIRDRAILLFFAVYGLRSGEVARLRLEDIDWANERITIARTKQHCSQLYPLNHEVGSAIVRYLQEVRPALWAPGGLPHPQGPFPPSLGWRTLPRDP